MGRVWTLTPKYHKPKEPEPEPLDPIEAYRLATLALPMVSRADADVLPAENAPETPGLSRESLIVVVVLLIVLLRK